MLNTIGPVGRCCFLATFLGAILVLFNFKWSSWLKQRFYTALWLIADMKQCAR